MNDDKGYIVLDILLGIFIFSLGFAAAWEINVSAVLINGQAENMFKAVNLAESTVEELYSDLQEDGCLADLYTMGEIREQEGLFNKVIRANWETPNLLLIEVEVEWVERERHKEYCLESYCYVNNC